MQAHAGRTESKKGLELPVPAGPQSCESAAHDCREQYAPRGDRLAALKESVGGDDGEHWDLDLFKPAGCTGEVQVKAHL
jgi:hypothetical protein